MKNMTHLSVVDGTFLHLESPEMPMHVGSLALFEQPENDDGQWFEKLKATCSESNAFSACVSPERCRKRALMQNGCCEK
jgi:hypothetical protein